MATTTVRRAQDGTDRLYVRAVDGRRLGWHDLASGATHLEDAGAGTLVGAAVARYVAIQSPLHRRGVGVLVGPRVVGTVLTAPRPPAVRRGEDGAEPEDLRERTAGETTARALLQALPATVPTGGRWARLTGRDPLSPVNRAHHQLVLAQHQVGEELAGLGRGWRSLHCVPVGADVGAGQEVADHLLLGPGGVLVVRTCAHPRQVVSVVGETVLAGGLPSPVLQLARSQAAAVAEQLGRARRVPVPVRALVVVVGARRLEVHGVPRGATVLSASELVRWLQDRPTVLSSVEVARLFEAAARPVTWTGTSTQAEPMTESVGRLVDGTTEGAGGLSPRQRRGRRRHEQARLDDWSAAVAAAARARLVGRLALLGCTAAALAAAVVLAVGA